MPTGYTSNIENMNFEQFTMGCARAFGALISMRDEPQDAEIPERFEPSNYHLEQYKLAETDLSYYELMSHEDAKQICFVEWQEAEQERLKNLGRVHKLKAKYEQMIDKVNNWIPPSKDHQQLKEFMLDQLTKSMKFDCNDEYYLEVIPQYDPQQWLSEKVEKAKHNIEYHRDHYKQECERCKERSDWVNQLRSSLK